MYCLDCGHRFGMTQQQKDLKYEGIAFSLVCPECLSGDVMARQNIFLRY